MERTGILLAVVVALCWGLLAMVSFGVMLFGIGLAAGKWGWYTPIFWTRTFAALALLLLTSRRRFRFQPSDQPGIATKGKRASALLCLVIALIAYELPIAKRVISSFAMFTIEPNFHPMTHYGCNVRSHLRYRNNNSGHRTPALM